MSMPFCFFFFSKKARVLATVLATVLIVQAEFEASIEFGLATSTKFLILIEFAFHAESYGQGFFPLPFSRRGHKSTGKNEEP